MKPAPVITETKKDHVMLPALVATRPDRPANRSWLAMLAQAVALHRQRARLAELDDHLLRDIGLSRDDARAEAQRSFWDVPAHWRH